MKLPPAVLATRDRYVAAFPLWSMPQGPAAEEKARTWTLGLCSQVAFEHGTSYGSKRADPNRPISKDALAQQGTPLLCWDMLTGAGSGSPSVVPDPESIDITGQVFVIVSPVDVITEGAHPPEPEEPPPPSNAAIPYNEGYAVQFGNACNDVYRETGGYPDGGMISVHSQRAAWDYYVGGLSWDASYRKHVNEFRAEYGLAPI